jgi:CelD/BcsL family acetyltransferase involved in cellulose biosynthesis
VTEIAGAILGATIPPVALDASPFDVELIRSWDEACARLGSEMARGTTTPFQHRHWLDAWYHGAASNASGEPLIAVVTDIRRRAVVAILPLYIRPQRGLRIAEFAGSADYNAPILGAAALEHPVDADLFWSAVRRALSQMPNGCDLVRFGKMPVTIAGVANPLASLPGSEPSALSGHVLQIGEDFDAYRYSLEKTVRKELERSWRVFVKNEGAKFQHLRDLQPALQVFTALETQQSARMLDRGHEYFLDEAGCSAFHRDLIARGLAGGYVVVTALTCGEEIVAALLGLRVNSTYLMLRISNAGQGWATCSPGRLIIERTMAALHADGVRTFDFSVGSYDYKRRFGVKDVPLVDLTVALSWRGRAMIGAKKAVQSMRRVSAAIRRRHG